MFVRVLQLHKRDSYEYKFIQDKYSVNLKKKIISIADGTTQSYDSGFWAKAICEHFSNSPNFYKKELAQEFKIEAEKVKNREIQFNSNPAKAALERDKLKKGSTSTFLGIRLENKYTVEVVSLGDSNLFVIDNNEIRKSYPFKNLNEINSNNDFLNTQTLFEEKFNPDLFSATKFKIESKDKIILTTDALSRFLFKFPEKINDILELDSFEKFLAFIKKQWEKGLLEEDDITAVIIDSNSKDKLEIICPPENFTFPKQIEKEFVPNSIQKGRPHKLIFSEMQMSEIRNQFNGVANDFYSLKRKLRFQGILLILITFLTMINISFLLIGSEKETQVEGKIGDSKEMLILKNKKINQLQNENSFLKKKLESKNLKKTVDTKQAGEAKMDVDSKQKVNPRQAEDAMQEVDIKQETEPMPSQQ